ncbi:uncharacterized protein LOC126851927 [Cataglyphis hispanica]|uniref:uncharacterized protein LOC126851927 n=1 Tax=Cataglyphis hispanica TaxID=1086592 RepID=UPI00217F76CF|nr:uncharacterized protein LOC126851927 [Cataglyphis hispanica]
MPEITIEEVKQMIPKTKIRKAPGIDDITNELIKYGDPEIQQEITKLFHKIISHEKTPIEWKTNHTYIQKKDAKKTQSQTSIRVRLDNVINTLKVNNNLLKIIEELNQNNTIKIKTFNGLSDTVPIATYIRQGDSLSPTFLNVIMNEIIEEMKKVDARYKIGNRYIKILCYADDAILLAKSEENLQRLLYKFTTTSQSFNMVISTEKTWSMVISKEPIRCKLVINDEIIEQVMKLNYLGIEASSDRNIIREVQTQADKANRISGYLKDIIWRNKYMITESKV